MDFDEWWKKQPTRAVAAGFKDDARMIWELATKAEREACAKVCESEAAMHRSVGSHGDAGNLLNTASAIRERSNVK